MRKLKKMTALLLSLAMIASLCTFQMATSVAAEEEEVPSVVIADEDLLMIEKLEAFGAISNEYDPTSYATRREMAQIVATYMALPSSGTVAESPFGDVDASSDYFGEIKALYDLGVITGDENGNFLPDENVTYDEALVFIVNAIGHKIFAQRSGGYPTGYHRIAIQHDMLDDLHMVSGKDDALIVDIYKMLNAALSASMVETSYYGDGSVNYTLSTTETFLSNTYGIRKYRGQVTGNEWTRLTSADSTLKDEQIEIDGVVYETPGYIYGYFLGYNVDYYLTDDTEGGLPALMYIEETPKANEVVKVDSDDILAAKTTSDRIYYEYGDKEEHLQFVSYVDVIYNSQCYTGYGMLKNVLPASGCIEALDNNRDGVYDVLFVYDYKNVVVKSVDVYNETIVDEITGDTYNLDVADGNVRIVASDTEKSVSFGTISRGSVLSVARSRSDANIMTVYVSKKSVIGKITSYSSDFGYEINGTYYKAASDYHGTALSIGTIGEFHLDVSGRIAAYSYSDTGETINLAAVAGVDYEEGALKDTITLRIFTSAGKMEDHLLKKRVKIEGMGSYDLTSQTERTEVLRILCQNYQSGGKYQLNDSYIIKYNLDNEKNINYIDMGQISAFNATKEGAFNNIADHYSSIRSCTGNIVELINLPYDKAPLSSAEMHITRISPEHIVFVTPGEGNLNEADGYQIKSGLVYNKYHADPNKFPDGNDGVIESVDNISAYSFGKSIYPMVDVVLLRGGGTASSINKDADVKLNVITDITEVVDKDDQRAYKLYQGDTAIGVLATENVSLTTYNGTEVKAENYTAADIIANNRIKAGDVIQVSYDADGNVAVIRVISEYDAANDRIIPLFYSPDRFIGTELMIHTVYSNMIVGQVTEVDLADSNIVAFTAGTYERIFDASSTPTVIIYDTVKNKTRTGTVEEIQIGDKFTLRTYSGYMGKEIVIFR